MRDCYGWHGPIMSVQGLESRMDCELCSKGLTTKDFEWSEEWKEKRIMPTVEELKDWIKGSQNDCTT